MPASKPRKKESLAHVVSRYNGTGGASPRVPFTRKRTLSTLSGTGFTGTVIGDFVSFNTPHPYNLVAKQVTTSFENPGWVLLERMKRNPSYRRLPRRLKPIENRNFGSPFTTERQRYRGSHDSRQFAVYISPTTGKMVRCYIGPIFAWRSTNSGATSGFPTLTPVSELELIARGTKFISQTIPTNPVAGVATFLGELREGLPKIPGRAVWQAQDLADLSRKAGSEYLNVSFGILPMVADVVKMARAVKESEKTISQYVRNSGRHVRRRASLPAVTTTEVTDLGTATTSPPLHSTLYSSGPVGHQTRTRVTTTKWSFSACYSYYLNPGKTSLGRFARSEQIANKLLGTRLTPEVLWELTPWSWAADYVGNIGDVLTNVSALMADSLVIRWAYVMCEQRVTDTYTTTGVSFKGGPSGPFSQTFETVRKVRRQATPYGFGLDPDGFTARQWAIIGALGMSRGPRQL